MSKILQLTPYAPATWASTAFFGLTRPLHLLFLLSEFCPLGVHVASFLLSLSKWGLWLFCPSFHPLLHWPSLSPSCLILLSIFNGHLTVFPIYVCMYVYSFTSYPFPVFLPGKSHGQRSLAGITWNHKSHTQLSDWNSKKTAIYLFIFLASRVFVAGHGLLQLQHMGSVVVAQGLSCPRQVRSSWTRDQIPCPLHW